MPTYDYECSNCGYEYEVFQKFEEEPLKKCPSCKKMKLFRVVTGGLHASVKNINTIGQLADHNSKVNKSLLNETAAMKKEIEPKVEEPWFNKYGNATTKEINKMTEKQKIKYIMEGEK